MEFHEIGQMALLFDFYGKLLSSRQKQVLALYCEENLSLGEIAIEFSISRQGVHDALKNGSKALEDYEKKLGLVEKFKKQHDRINEIKKLILVIEERQFDKTQENIEREIARLKDIINSLEV